MSALVISDLHLSANPRDEYRFRFLHWVRDRVRKYDALIVNGDLTEEKDRHPSVLVNRVVDEFASIAKHKPVIFNKGNHDYTDVDHPFFAFLQHIDNVQWVSHPTLLAKDFFGCGSIVMLPHTSQWKKDWKQHLGDKWRGADYVLCHQTFEGTKMPNGHVTGNVPTNLFSSAHVFSGDVHTPGNVGRVHYIGAPYTVDFGDDYDGRCLVIGDLELRGGEVMRTWQWIKYTGPQKRLIVFAADAKDELVLESVERCNPGDIVKVRVHLDAHNRSQWAHIRKLVDKWAVTHKVELHSCIPVIEKGRIKATHKSFAKKTDEELLTNFVRARDLDKATAKLGAIIMRKV